MLQPLEYLYSAQHETDTIYIMDDDKMSDKMILQVCVCT